MSTLPSSIYSRVYEANQQIGIVVGLLSIGTLLAALGIGAYIYDTAVKMNRIRDNDHVKDTKGIYLLLYTYTTTDILTLFSCEGLQALQILAKAQHHCHDICMAVYVLPLGHVLVHCRSEERYGSASLYIRCFSESWCCFHLSVDRLIRFFDHVFGSGQEFGYRASRPLPAP